MEVLQRIERVGAPAKTTRRTTVVIRNANSPRYRTGPLLPPIYPERRLSIESSPLAADSPSIRPRFALEESERWPIILDVVSPRSGAKFDAIFREIACLLYASIRAASPS